jgi:transcriptional regulator with XRE-family HTH domain
VGLAAFRGERLAEARRAAGLTQAQLAEAVGVSNGLRVSMWERGAEQPRPRFFPVLAAVLELEPLALFAVDPADPPLSALRLAAGLSLPDIQAVAAVPVMTYQRLERGIGSLPPRDATVGAVATAFGVTPDRVRAAIDRARNERAAHPPV